MNISHCAIVFSYKMCVLNLKPFWWYWESEAMVSTIAEFGIPTLKTMRNKSLYSDR